METSEAWWTPSSPYDRTLRSASGVSYTYWAPALGIVQLVLAAEIQLRADQPGQVCSMQKALFLDRDGVVNIECAYAHRREDFQFQDGIFDLCRAAESLGYLLFVVTNQAGIARGYYSEEQFLDLTRWMIDEFASRGIRIRKVYYCPYHPEHGIGRYKVDSPDRKPGPGMLLSAQIHFDLDLQNSVLIGDQITDICAAEAAGVGTRIWLRLNPPDSGSDLEASYHVAHSLRQIQSRYFSSAVPRSTGGIQT